MELDPFNIVLYILLFMVLISLILLIFKLIATLYKVDAVVDDVNKKSKKLDNLFDVVDVTTEGLSFLGDTFVNLATGFVTSMFKKSDKKQKKKKKDGSDDNGEKE